MKWACTLVPIVLPSLTVAGCAGISWGFKWTWAYDASTIQVAQRQWFHLSRNLFAPFCVSHKKLQVPIWKAFGTFVQLRLHDLATEPKPKR